MKTSPANCRVCAGYGSLDEQDRIDLMIEGEMPTCWWHCERCGRHLERWRGQGDVICDCGAQYNAGGQRLRDDWRPMPFGYDELELGDMEEYELNQLAREQP